MAKPIELTPNNIAEAIENMSDEDLSKIAFMVPWSGSQDSARPQQDEDGFPTLVNMTDFTNFHKLQLECWNKFVQNPQINSYIRDYMGSLTGYGFETNSEIPEIQAAIDEMTDDMRNDLEANMPKYAARAEVEGELFLSFTIHRKGFVEIDFMEPSALKGGGDSNSGIIFHPHKPAMPLMYLFTVNTNKGTEIVPIPSINLAYYPELMSYVRSHLSWRGNAKNLERKRGSSYKNLGGLHRFIVSWDRGFFTRRNVSHIRTTIEWINHYETLKKYEIDHKRSSGAYLWVAKITDPKAYRAWLAMSDEQKQKSGLLQKKSPGGTIVLPPGIDLDVKNPDLPKISDQDTDILRMVISGLNRPEDVVTGQSSSSTFAGIKSSRGPMSDRTKDDIAYFDRFLRLHFWRGIFFLKSSVDPAFEENYDVKMVVGYGPGKEKKPIVKDLKTPAYKLVHVTYPTSEVSDIESTAKAYLGVKHGSVIDTLGIPAEEVANKLGFNGWPKLRLRQSAEIERYPELVANEDDEALQESKLEPGKNPKEPVKETVKPKPAK